MHVTSSALSQANKSPVRAQLLSPNPPQPNNLPIAMITGQLVMPKAQYVRQLSLANSFYLAYDGTQRMVAGLIDVSEDQETAKLFWQLSWVDPAAIDPSTFWTFTASKSEMLNYVRRRIEHWCPEVKEIIAATDEKDMLQPPLVIKDYPPHPLPEGRVTLLGDAAHGMTFCKLSSSMMQRCNDG